MYHKYKEQLSNHKFLSFTGSIAKTETKKKNVLTEAFLNVSSHGVKANWPSEPRGSLLTQNLLCPHDETTYTMPRMAVTCMFLALYITSIPRLSRFPPLLLLIDLIHPKQRTATQLAAPKSLTRQRRFILHHNEKAQSIFQLRYSGWRH
ncbi:hypothetical protein E2C01_077549 [Portunus trituberculatus]|uniref:Uncharacterized protein n=1 Tax=Portunus trituberculatus TaxID=210409 RepID=A0A5B7IKI1_PORTR|nr:hypothetical protein [Portunus trituberculatus]